MEADLFDQNYFPKRFPGSIAGCDEVGRGPLAGPVVSAVVWFYGATEEEYQRLTLQLHQLQAMGVTDSKKLTSQKRLKILKALELHPKDLVVDRPITLSTLGPHWKAIITAMDAKAIDQFNILKASLMAMEKGVSLGLLETLKEGSSTGKLLIDGNKKLLNSFEQVEQIPIVKGDQLSTFIALASIIAKEYRDDVMRRWDLIYPGYGFKDHAGYPTAFHREKISQLGPSSIHRLSFKGVKEYVAQSKTTKGIFS